MAMHIWLGRALFVLALVLFGHTQMDRNESEVVPPTTPETKGMMRKEMDFLSVIREILVNRFALRTASYFRKLWKLGVRTTVGTILARRFEVKLPALVVFSRLKANGRQG